MLRTRLRWLAPLSALVAVFLTVAPGFTPAPAGSSVSIRERTAGPLTAPVAHADSDDNSDDDSITQYDVHAALHRDGSLAVTLDFTFDFGSDSGHGPYLTLPERMAIPGDSRHWRSLPVSDIHASSPDAPAKTEIDHEGGVVLVKIGDADREIEGRHHYHVTYTIQGVVNPRAKGSGLDELNWNAVGNAWEIPLSRVSVKVTTPAPIRRVGCFLGSDWQTPCGRQPMSSGKSATYQAGRTLQPGEGLQIVAGMPAGSFPGVHPILTERYTAGRVLGLNPVSAGIGAVLLAGGAAFAIRLVRRFGGDQRYLGVPPGQRPAPGQPVDIGRDSSHPVAVQFHPPQGVTPGQIGVLLDAKAQQRDVTATVIDLATRGFLRIEKDGGAKADRWRLVPLDASRQGLRPYERKLLDSLFLLPGSPVDLDKGTLTRPSIECQQGLYGEVTKELGWFRRDPRSARHLWVGVGFGLTFIGVTLLFALGYSLGIGFAGLGVALVGVLVIFLSPLAPGRTAEGTAVRDQALGFKEYLKTAEADQIRFEEGIDVFSRYLPYAMIWGLTDRWTRIFAELAERGMYQPQPTWYVGPAPFSFGTGSSFASAMNSFDSAASSAMTSGSGGGSGFSGGGGVGGGGGGGW